MKVKASMVLKEALVRHLAGAQNCTYICCAIQDVETDLRYEHKVKELTSNALQLFKTFRPKTVAVESQDMQPWWPKGDPVRVDTLNKTIEMAVKRND